MYLGLLPSLELRVSSFVAGLVLTLGYPMGVANAANLVTYSSYQAALIPSEGFRTNPSSSTSRLTSCIVGESSEISPSRCEIIYIPIPLWTNLVRPQYLTQYTPLPPLVDPGSRYAPQYVPQSLPPLGKPGYTPQYRSPSNGSSNHGSSQRAICEGDCNQKCTILSSFGATGAYENCLREVSNCKARCQ